MIETITLTIDIKAAEACRAALVYTLENVFDQYDFACKGALGFWEAPAAFIDPWDAQCAR